MSVIIPFPAKHLKPNAPAISPDATSASSGSRKPPTDCPAHAMAVASAIAGAADGSDHGPVLDVPRIVGLVLRACRRLGGKPSRMSLIIAHDLERHCELGDTTAILLREWLADGSSFHVGVPEAIAAAEAAAPVAGEG